MEQEHDAEGEVYLDGDALVPGHALLQQTCVISSIILSLQIFLSSSLLSKLI